MVQVAHTASFAINTTAATLRSAHTNLCFLKLQRAQRLADTPTTHDEWCQAYAVSIEARCLCGSKAEALPQRSVDASRCMHRVIAERRAPRGPQSEGAPAHTTLCWHPLEHVEHIGCIKCDICNSSCCDPGPLVRDFVMSPTYELLTAVEDAIDQTEFSPSCSPAYVCSYAPDGPAVPPGQSEGQEASNLYDLFRCAPGPPAFIVSSSRACA